MAETEVINQQSIIDGQILVSELLDLVTDADTNGATIAFLTSFTIVFTKDLTDAEVLQNEIDAAQIVLDDLIAQQA